MLQPSTLDNQTFVRAHTGTLTCDHNGVVLVVSSARCPRLTRGRTLYLWWVRTPTGDERIYVEHEPTAQRWSTPVLPGFWRAPSPGEPGAGDAGVRATVAWILPERRQPLQRVTVWPTHIPAMISQLRATPHPQAWNLSWTADCGAP